MELEQLIDLSKHLILTFDIYGDFTRPGIGFKVKWMIALDSEDQKLLKCTGKFISFPIRVTRLLISQKMDFEENFGNVFLKVFDPLNPMQSPILL